MVKGSAEMFYTWKKANSNLPKSGLKYLVAVSLQLCVLKERQQQSNGCFLEYNIYLYEVSYMEAWNKLHG